MDSLVTAFPNGVSSFGMTLTGNGLPATFGKIVFVDYDNGSDGNDGVSMNTAVKTIAQAYSMVRTNKHDGIALSANSTHVLTEMLTIAKNRVHLIGLDGVGGRRLGQRTKVSLGVTTAATDLAAIKVTGSGCSFRSMKVMSSNTVAESLYAMIDAGEYTYMESCEVYKSTDLDGNLAAEFVCNGDSGMYVNCAFGSSANIIATAKIRPNVLLTGEIVTGKKARDVQFKNCLFLSKAGGTAHVAVYGANATDVERMLLMENCVFMNNALSAATPAHAVGFGAAQTEGSVLLKDCTSVDHTVMAEAAVGVYVDGAVPGFATSGVSVAS